MNTLYTSDGCAYMGMDEATVRRLRSELGLPTILISKEIYDSFILAHKVK